MAPARLSSAFQAPLPGSAAQDHARITALEEALQTALQTARAAFPEVKLSEALFAQHLAAHAGHEPSPAEAIARLHAADLYLACACGQGIPSALRAFERDHLSQVPRYLARTDSSAAFADEVCQVLRNRLFVAAGSPPKILEYGGRGSLGAWLRITAVRTARNLLRPEANRPSSLSPDALEEALGAAADPEIGHLLRRHGPEITAALREAILGLSPEQRNLLRLYHIDGLSFERMGTLFQVNRATVCRWLAEARRTVLAQTKAHFRAKRGLSESECEGLLSLLRSQLDISLAGILAPRV
jgi:RNA polymerase sigma-70 factor (ECF subfamily)